MIPIWLEHLNKIAGILTPVILGAATYFFARKRYRFDRENARYQRDSEVIKWFQECMNAIGEIEHFVLSSNISGQDASERKKNLSRAISKLSILIDFGRMIFPNRVDDTYGVQKQSAYQGYRHEALDNLIKIYTLSKSFDVHQNDEVVWNQLINVRRQFVSVIQGQIDPLRRIEFLKKEAYLHLENPNKNKNNGN